LSRKEFCLATHFHLLEQFHLPIEANGRVEYVAFTVDKRGDCSIRIRINKEGQIIEFRQTGISTEVVEILNQMQAFTGFPFVQNVGTPTHRLFSGYIHSQ